MPTRCMRCDRLVLSCMDSCVKGKCEKYQKNLTPYEHGFIPCRECTEGPEDGPQDTKRA